MSKLTVSVKTGQLHTDAARVVQHRYAAVQERKDAPGILRVELAEFTHSGGVELNPPDHSAS